ncbi:MAG: hypothetical protein ROZ00_00895 [Denitratisoma sp.]|nr:hypothetical protein [Denitratisoma sp.]
MPDPIAAVRLELDEQRRILGGGGQGECGDGDCDKAEQSPQRP